MEPITRIDPSLLRRGAVFDLDDLRTEHASEAYRDAFLSILKRHGVRRSMQVEVDYLIRTGPESYDVVIAFPQLNYADLDVARMIIDSRYITSVVEQNGRGYMVVKEQLYDEALYERYQTFSGDTLVRDGNLPEQEIPGHRSGSRYIRLIDFPDYVMNLLRRHYPRPRAFLSQHRVTQQLFDRLPTTGFAVPVELTGAQDHKVVYVRLNVKKLRRWLKRHQSCFYAGTAEPQKVRDEFDVTYAQEERERLEQEAQATREHNLQELENDEESDMGVAQLVEADTDQDDDDSQETDPNEL